MKLGRVTWIAGLTLLAAGLVLLGVSISKGNYIEIAVSIKSIAIGSYSISWGANRMKKAVLEQIAKGEQ